MTTMSPRTDGPVTSTVPARMDRLPWTRFHWSVVVGLGVSWILDGLEVQLVSVGAFAETFHMTPGEVGFTGTIYLLGQVIGALFFGRLTDRLGRKRLFILTLAIYLIDPINFAGIRNRGCGPPRRELYRHGRTHCGC